MEPIPKEIEETIHKAFREGVYFKRTKGREFRSMGWRPGDPNPLAEAIISHVHDRTELVLDGHKYWIEPQ